MRNKREPRTHAEEGQWQINNTLIAFLIAVVLSAVIAAIGHFFAVAA